MSNKVSIFNFSINPIISNDQPALDQAKIRLLYYGFWIVLVAVVGLLVSVYLQHQTLLTITAAIVLASVLFLFKYLTYKPHWKQISHSLLILGVVVNLNNAFVTMQTVDIITVQIILLSILFSYYMLGQKWGLFYSLLNLIPILVFLILLYNGNYSIKLRPERIDQATIIISLFANFIIIIYIHSYFYSAFLENIKQLKETGKEQIELNQKLGLAIEKAEKSSQIKSEFLSAISHEIRTPLNAVIGMSNLMIMGNPRPDQKENLNILKFSANNLLSIVNDVLDFSKIESGKVVFENTRFNMVELAQNICGAQKIKATEKGLIFDLYIDPILRNKVLFGDPTRLSQVLFNLISNAIKFTKNGQVWVKISIFEDRHNTVTVNFSVKDTGIGIEQNKLESIFEPFTQAPTAITAQFGGTGLGLAIVKRLLELQGLQMGVASTVGKGSEFSFNMEFSVSTETVDEVAEKQLLAQNHEGEDALRILIAEDNPVNVMLMKKLFAKWNLIPTIAENGERAVELLLYGNFDVILMDLQMPVMNGFEATMEIRKFADPKKAGIPIIALTASALSDIRERVFNCGMNDYVAKPFKPEELIEKIHHQVAAYH